MKRIFLSALLIAGALSSCSKNEIVDKAPIANDNLDIIGVEIAAAATRGTETTADLIRTSDDLVLSFYATHWDLNSDYGLTSATASSYVGKIEFEYDSEWSQTSYSYYESSSANQSASYDNVAVTAGSNDLLWGDLSIGDTDSAGSDAPTAYFFSMHNGSSNVALQDPVLNTGDATVTVAASGTTPAFIQNAWYKNSTIADTTTSLTDQVDLVYYAGEVSAFPSGGNIRGTFHHALSRLEMYSSQGEYSPYIKSVALVNVDNGGDATITYETSSTDASIAWDDTSATDVSYIYYNNNDASDALQTIGTAFSDGNLISSTQTAQPYNNIMMVPQTLEKVNYGYAANGSTISTFNDILCPSSNGSDSFGDYAYMDIDAPYVAMIYRMTTVVGSDNASVVGYKYAIDCDSYAEGIKEITPTVYDVYSLESDAQVNLASLDNTSSNYLAVAGTTDNIYNNKYTEQEMYDLIMAVESTTAEGTKEALSEYVTYNMGITPVSHLYMLVGFPLGADIALEAGKDYDFNIGIGTTGGILLHPYYVDAYGRSTRIKITDVAVGEYVLATASTPIGITITVDSWDAVDSAEEL